MLEQEYKEELLSVAETEDLGEYTIHNFHGEEIEWDEVLELGAELEAKVIGRKDNSEKYFLSIRS